MTKTVDRLGAVVRQKAALALQEPTGGEQFEDAADAIGKRDVAIREASELYGKKKDELRGRQIVLQSRAGRGLCMSAAQG